jgi:hypothetical protein
LISLGAVGREGAVDGVNPEPIGYNANNRKRTSMADDKTSRSYRASELHRHSAEPGRPGTGDPLAELARLIGQTDPYGGAGEPRLRRHDWIESVHDVAETEASASHDHLAAHQSDPYRMAPVDEREGEWQGLHASPSDDPYYQSVAAHAGGHPRHHDAYDYERAAAEYESQGVDYHGDDVYDDPPKRRRSGALITAVTLIGCALVGTAGAYGYRSYYIDNGSKRAPVITADRTPAKIVPADAGNKASKAPAPQAAPAERIVPREEQPVILKPPGSATGPRVVLAAPVPASGTAVPSAAAPPPPPAAATAPPAAATAPPPPAPPPAAATPSEPKRIRTVTIRPDGGDASGRPVGTVAAAESSPPARRPAVAAPQQSVGQAPPARAPRTTASAPSFPNAPLSLDPSGTGSTRQPAPVGQSRPLTPPAPRVAAVAPPPPRSNGTGNGGGYLVQVSSQRSEADARASFRALQGKYPQVLNGRQAVVRRADLGKRGIYYRAMIGPLSSSEASQLCSSLKAAGGQCIIQRN